MCVCVCVTVRVYVYVPMMNVPCAAKMVTSQGVVEGEWVVMWGAQLTHTLIG